MSQATAPRAVASPPKAGLGEVLIEMGAITRPVLEAALAHQRQHGGRLGEILVAQGTISAQTMADGLARRLGVPRARLSGGVDPAVLDLLDERSRQRYRVIPLAVEPGGALLLATADPSDVLTLDDLRMLVGRDIRPALALDAEIDAFLNAGDVHADNFLSGLVREAAPAAGRAGGELDFTADLGRIDGEAAPVVRMVGSVVSRAVEEGASDIHLEAQADEMLVRYRIDGVIRTVAAIPAALSREVVSRIKVMADMDIAERRLPQDGRVSLTAAGHRLDLRVVTVPTVHGEGVVIRILDTSNAMRKLSELGFARDTLERFTACYRRPYGAVLVSGPTGSGKSTTLYGALHALNTGDRKIITIEDPVEYRLAGINQVQVNTKAGLTFAAGLRSLLRSDPDTLMIGEVRDGETAQIMMQAALTGHLVMATIHTNDAASALTRLTEMGVEPFISASGVLGVLAQRLARRLCPECRTPVTVPATTLREFAGTATLPEGVGETATIHKSVGCRHCRQTGYRGRVGIYEMLTMSEEVERLTAASAPSSEIRRQARREGMRTMREDGVLKVLAGETTLNELARTVA
ncbi:GspE/PulE family protein [Miltoncostaea marina]|uniref:GspE/PulE family protein n=1 Tax=Miltoncostaea marina TaxID=2843215 RepID=UPI001C3D62FC|nr:GspE/PulE family protein [Miltoncostaea marina]